VVGGLSYRKLIASWISQVQMKLAILLLIGRVGTVTLNGLERIKPKGDDGLIRGQDGADATSRATITRVAGLLNRHLLRSLTRAVLIFLSWQRDGRGRGHEESGGAELHDE